VILPHDGAHGDKVFATSYERAIREAGFDVFVIPNQGQGAASARIETARRLFPRVFFNKDTTEEGREAPGWYHEKKSTDPERDIGLGPNHDWSSHCVRPDVHPLRSAGRCSAPSRAIPRPQLTRGRRIMADHVTAWGFPYQYGFGTLLNLGRNVFAYRYLPLPECCDEAVSGVQSGKFDFDPHR
jgi:hypothetical protein